MLDTNTVVSAIGWVGTPRRVLLTLTDGVHQLVTSPALLSEVQRVLHKPKLRVASTNPDLKEILSWLHQPEHVVNPAETLSVIAEDPDDDRVLEAAIAGKADVIVSGDHHLLALKSFRGIPILSAAEFVERHLQAR